MKITTLFIIHLLFSTLAIGQQAFEKGNVRIQFEKMHLDLGDVKRGDIRKTAFNFKNTGAEAIEIEIVDGCECTTLDWPRKPIQPGEKARIDVTFDSTEKEKSEVIDIDVTLKNKEPETGNPIFVFLTYTYQLIQ